MVNTALSHNNISFSEMFDEPALSSLDTLKWTSLQLDSRLIETGDIYVALQGQHANGEDFIDSSISRGAVAVLINTNKPMTDKKAAIEYRNGTPIVRVFNLVENLSAIAGRSFSCPSESLNVVGITGTNGKTTCSVLIAQLLSLLDSPSGVVGTLGYGKLQEDQALSATSNTTPDAISSQRILAELRNNGVDTVAMEISSHGLDQSRVAAVCFSTAVFTNLTQDHLDYHGSLERYGKAKARLLESTGLRQGVFNYDDSWSKSLSFSKSALKLERVFTYSTHSDKADIFLSNTAYNSAGIRGVLHTPLGSGDFLVGLVGEFNVSNVLVAVAVALLQGHSLAAILPLLSQLQAPKGRMQSVQVGLSQDIQVIVDYAHTPDALEKSLQALRHHTQGQLWCVFGCGGDRDKDKRSLMGGAAERLSDCVVITNDNPRSEDPAQIASDILSGMKSPERCLTIAARDKAIELSVQQAHSGDAVLIAGKGHEEHQVFAGYSVPFSDVEQSVIALGARLKRQDSLGVALL